MAETTTINQNAEIPADYQNIFAEKLEELKHINQNIERSREEINWLQSETHKTLERIKNQIKEF